MCVRLLRPDYFFVCVICIDLVFLLILFSVFASRPPALTYLLPYFMETDLEE